MATIGGGPPFTGSVSYLLSSLGYLSASGFAASLATVDLEPRHFALLQHISGAEGRSQQELGDLLHIPASRMVAIVDELEGRGLLERRVNPRDRRAHALHLTPKGRRALTKSLTLAGQHEERICRALTGAQRDQLLRLLNGVAADLGLRPGVHPGLTQTHRDCPTPPPA